MPVKVRKVRGKYRIVEGDGKVAKTRAGNARDAGGHSVKNKADAQARAINANIERK